jgi:hypothetical protein
LASIFADILSYLKGRRFLILSNKLKKEETVVSLKYRVWHLSFDLKTLSLYKPKSD